MRPLCTLRCGHAAVRLVLLSRQLFFSRLLRYSWHCRQCPRESTTPMGDPDSLGPTKLAPNYRRCAARPAFGMAAYAVGVDSWSFSAVPAGGLGPPLLYDVSDKFRAMPGG